MIDETYQMMDAKYELSIRSTNIRILTSLVRNYPTRIAMGVALNLSRACACSVGSTWLIGHVTACRPVGSYCISLVGVVGLLSEWEVHYIKVLICEIELADTRRSDERPKTRLSKPVLTETWIDTNLENFEELEGRNLKVYAGC